MMFKKLQQISGSFDFCFFGILLGAIVMWILAMMPSGAMKNYSIRPLVVFVESVKFFRAMGPLVLIALGFAVASRAGSLTLVFQDKLSPVGSEWLVRPDSS